MAKITLVTAFFPMNRDKWEGFVRTNQNYIEYFKFWARIQNDLIVYTTKEIADEIMKIRKGFGRTNTKIVVVDDISLVDKELHSSLQKVANTKESVDFRFYPENPESWNSDYNYMMCLKYLFMDMASKENPNGMLAWIDFGFNHGGELYSNPEDFDFLWEYDFDEKINIFALDDLNTLPIFEVTRRLFTYIQGSLIVGSARYWIKLWPIFRQNVLSMSNIGLMDDDQTYMLLTYRTNPELFCVHNTEKWHSQFLLCSNQKFQIAQPKKECKLKTFLKKIKNNLKFRIRAKKYCKKYYKHLIHDKTIYR